MLRLFSLSPVLALCAPTQLARWAVLGASLTLAACGGGGGGGGGDGDEGTFPEITILDAGITEGDSGSKSLEFRVGLSKVSAVDVTFAYASSDISAAAGIDYEPVNAFDGNIPAGEFFTPIYVEILGDEEIEGTETFELKISSISNADAAGRTAIGSIFDNDGPNTLPDLSIRDRTVTEGDTGSQPVEFTLDLSEATSVDVTGTYETTERNFGATSGEDFVAASGSFTIPAGQRTTTITITVLGDTAQESKESFNVTIADVQNANPARALGWGFITDNDAGASLSGVSINDAGITEGDAGSRTLAFTIELSAAADAAVSGSYSTSNGAAIAGEDYTATTGEFTIPAGQLSTVVNVAVLGDEEVEGTEAFTVTISDISNAELDDSTATGRIFNNDGAGALPGLSIRDRTVTEGDSGSQQVAFTIEISEATNVAVTGSYATANRGAVAGSDYVAASGDFVIPAGETSTTINIAVLGDTAQESKESFNINISDVQNADPARPVGWGFIVDNDGSASLPSVSINDAGITEGDAGSRTLAFTIELSAAADAAVSGSYSTSNGAAIAGEDYTAATGEFTIPAGQLSTVVNVAVLGDEEVEGTEAFTVTISNISNAELDDSTATGRIFNNDGAAALPGLSIRDRTVTEGNTGSQQVAFTIEISEATNVAVAGSYATANRGAVAGSDYVAASGDFVIPAGETSTTINIAVLGDTAQESKESFNINISDVQNADVVRSPGWGFIEDNDSGGGPGPDPDPESGLDSRPNNTSCVAPQRPGTGGGGGPITVVDAFSATFSNPIKILQAPGNGSRWYVLLRGGQIRTLDVSSPGTSSAWLTISGVNTNFEGGLLSMAFHPNWPSTRQVFVSYTSTAGGNTSRVSRLTLDNVNNPGSVTENVLVSIPQPAANHNGSDLAFGNDGFLYASFGDGGGAPGTKPQDTTKLLGSMLRIDVAGTSGSNYNIPGSNPFSGNSKCSGGSGSAACPEVYAWGFRNAFRFSIDKPTGDIWLGDVGEADWEEIDVVRSGGNYGWQCREGNHPVGYNPGCIGGPLLNPVFEYSHSGGDQSITGGDVYRGSIGSLNGRYIYGDFWSGKVWALQSNGSGGYTREQIYGGSGLAQSLTDFALGQDGELYMVGINTSRIKKFSGGDGGGTNTIPNNLADTGCLNTNALIPYDIEAPFWSDNAVKTRHIGLPNGTFINANESGDDDWSFPNGTVLVKDFELGGQRIETRLFMRHPDGVWAGYTYEWNDAQTAATRVVGGKTRSVNGQQWIYPSEAQCLDCHKSAAKYALGPETAQLNGNFRYPATGRTANQLATLEDIGVFSPALQAAPGSQPKLTDPTNTNASLNNRARAYLHTNCAGCHRPGGTSRSTMDLRYTTALGSTNTCNVEPGLGDLGVANARLIAPGAPGRSLVLNRMDRRDSNAMPPTGSTVVDSTGVNLINSWISSLSSCN